MVIQAYLPHVGGAERQLKALAPLLAAEDVDIHILTRRYTGMEPYELIDGVPVHRLPIPGPKLLASLSYTLSGLPLIKRLNPDLIHAHGLLSPALMATFAKRLLGIPVLAKVLRGGVLGDLARLKQKAFTRWRIAQLKKYIDAFIVISDEIGAELEAVGIPAQRHVNIPNGVNTERFAPLSPKDRKALRVEMGIDERPVVIYTGRLVAEKRVDHLVDIWPAVRREFPQAILMILGRGEQRTALQQGSPPGVRFLGLVDDVLPYLQVADVFVLPSATEGLSNSLLEAMAVGLPVVATRVGGGPDVIDQGRSGYLIPPDDVPALRSAVLELLRDGQLRRMLGERARQRMVADYSLHVVAKRLKALYTRLVGTEV